MALGAGDTISFSSLGGATGTNMTAISMSGLSGVANTSSVSDFGIDTVSSLDGFLYIDENTAETYTLTFTGAGTYFNSRIRTVGANFTWNRNNTNISLEANADYTCVVTGASVTDSPTNNYVETGLTASFADGANDHATNYNTEFRKSMRVYDTYGGTGVCFLPGTKILLSDGSEVNIEDLYIDDEVMSTSIPGLHDEDVSIRVGIHHVRAWREFKTNSTERFSHTTSVIVNHWWAFEDHYYDINDGELKVTGEHPLFIKRGDIYRWMEANSVRTGDYLVKYTPSGVEDVLITSTHKIKGEFEVVSIDVEEIDVYYANGFLVHNKGSNTPPP